MDEDGLSSLSGGLSSDFRDIETKLGRKVPDSLIRSLVGGNSTSSSGGGSKAPCCPAGTSHLNGNGRHRGAHGGADLKRLESKMLFLKQEMAHLRAIDVKLMKQLMSINEGIESIRWVMEEKGGPASQEGSLTGSLYSLSDSQDDGASLRGSYTSLNDGGHCSDGMDGISVGSYLDTLDFPDHPSPTPSSDLLDRFVVDKSGVIGDGGDAFTKPPSKLRVESDEYYCFG